MQTAVTVKDIQVDLGTRRVRCGAGEVTLTPQEYALLAVLVAHRGHAVSRGRLLQLAWGWAVPADAETRTVDVHIQHLRKKLGLGQEIETVYKVGYRLS